MNDNYYFKDIHKLERLSEKTIGNKIIVELKAVKKIVYIHFAQLRSYLKSTGL